MAEGGGMNPHVFIVGCPRSGTTLIERIVDAHPELAIVHESRWIARIYEDRRGLTADGRVTQKLARRLCQPRWFLPFGLDPDEMGATLARYDGAPYRDLVSALFDLYAARRHKRLAGDKSPGYVRYLPLLHDLWPSAKFVHIVRDGRDVFLSVVDWAKAATRFASYATDRAVTVARWWEWYVRLGREAGAGLEPDRYYELKYESLVADAALEIGRLCDFLAVPFDDRMIRFHQATKTRPITSGLRSWRAQMDVAELRRFEAAAGGLLAELGYPVSGGPSAEQEGIAQTIEAFDVEVRAGRWPMPHAWQRAAA
jgi:Sulfotransferase family